MVMQFKKGDTVRLRRGLVVGRFYGSDGIIFNKDMHFTDVKEIDEMFSDCGYRLENEGSYWTYTDEMLEYAYIDDGSIGFQIGDMVKLNPKLKHGARCHGMEFSAAMDYEGYKKIEYINQNGIYVENMLMPYHKAMFHVKAGKENDFQRLETKIDDINV